MKKYLLLSLLFTAFAFSAEATHYRAGEITYRILSYLTYEVTVTTYTTDINISPDSDSVQVDWGDGTIGTAWRNGNGTPLGNNIKRNVYTATHTYAGPLPFYLISVTDPNRVDFIENINGGNSVNIPFYVEDTLMIYNPSFTGVNNSPILLAPPIDFANVNDTFYHNPAAFDPDGDSLTFQLVSPLQETNLPVPNYVLPDQIQPGLNNDFSIDSRTGEILWATPQQTGIYNVAILVREYREGLLMGTVLRDMQIFVVEEFNNPPQVQEINDTCIIAGTVLNLNITATDNDPGQFVFLTAVGGPFQVASSPAIFVPQSDTGFAQADFQWETNCTHIRDQFYQVVFKASDNYATPSGPLPLVDIETWTIRVIAPPPENLTAEAVDEVIELEWDSPYACDASQTDNFIGFSVWRREGPNPFTIDTCEPGLAGKGYTLLEEQLFDYNYTDSAVTKGKNYCYRILAEFAEETALGFYYNKVYSLPSNEACSELRRDEPLITNTSVEVTNDANGELFIRWRNPLASVDHLDTTQFPGPYVYKLFGSTGFTVNAPTELVTYSSPTFQGLDDTTFTHTGINTVNGPYAYYVVLYGNNGNTIIDTSDVASSLYLTVGSFDERLELSWEGTIPWFNYAYEINRRNNSTGVYEVIDTVTDTTAYTDLDVINDTTYCYYVRSLGYYTATDLISDTLINLSQIACAKPIDTVAPCPPVLSAFNDCSTVRDGDECATENDDIFNQLDWTVFDSCSQDVMQFAIYYARPGTEVFEKVDSVAGDLRSFKHALRNTLAGCYLVTALDEKRNESEPSNVVCVDNCPCYILPNVFTPNGDGDNDLYTPRVPFLLVEEVEMKIYNRWGALVFETNDPNINWDGNTAGGQPLDEDVYYYVCKVFESQADGVQEADEILSGYIHLIRGNGDRN